MMQLVVTFCSLFFNLNASIFRPDTEVSILRGATPLNMDFWNSLRRGMLAWKGWLASQHNVALIGEPRMTK